MPLTPFHLGPALLLGLIFFRYLDFPTFLVANVIIDIEPILVVLLNLNYPLHGFFHSLLGGTIIVFLLAWFMNKIRGTLSPFLMFFKLEQKSSFGKILLSSISGIYIHILLDSRIHADTRPFWPFDFNPFLDRSVLAGLDVYILCALGFIGGIIAYAVKIALTRRNKKVKQNK